VAQEGGPKAWQERRQSAPYTIPAGTRWQPLSVRQRGRPA